MKQHGLPGSSMLFPEHHMPNQASFAIEFNELCSNGMHHDNCDIAGVLSTFR